MSPVKVYRNLLIVFFVTGLWHGASWNFIVWGLFHGFFIILERIGLGKILTRTWAPVRHAYTLLVVLIGWVFFRADTLRDSLQYLGKMFSLSDGEPARVSYLSYFFVNAEYLLIFILAILWSTPFLEKFLGGLFTSGEEKRQFQWIQVTLLLMLFILAASYVAADTYNPFIYFRF